MRPHAPIRTHLQAGRASPLGGLFLVLVSACTSVSQGGGQTGLMEATGTKVSPQELRASLDVLAIQVPGAIEAAADAVAAATTNPQLRRRALMWKIELVPAFYQALFNADPLAGLLDAWALSVQLEAYLETGAGSSWMVPAQPIALQGMKKVRSDIESMANKMAKSSAGFQRATAYVETWAKAHPIEGSLASRPSILTELAQEASKASDISVFQVVGDLPATVNDIAQRLDIYAAYLPKAGRWQAALMVDELSDRTEAQRAVATLESVEKLTERTNLLLSPEALRSALATATAEVQRERVAALASVDLQRTETLAYLTSEREAAVAAVDAQRRDVMADVDRQRTALLQQLDALRKQSFSDADGIATRVILKGALAVALLLVLAAVLTVLVLRTARRPKA
jgi:hypothetical protein